MALNRIFNQIPNIFKVKKGLGAAFDETKGKKFLFYSFLTILFFLIFIFIFNYIDQKNKREIQNFNKIVESNEFSNIGNYLIFEIR